MSEAGAGAQAAKSGPLPWFLRTRLGPVARSLPWHRPRLRVAAIMGSDEAPLRLWENWRRVMPALDALIALLPRPATIRPWHYHEDRPNRAIPYGRLNWSEPANRRWTATLADPKVYMAKTELWSPARPGTVEKRIDPDFYVQIGGGQVVERQGFVLALRLELLPQLAAAANEVVAAVAAAMPGSETLIADRTWAERRIMGWVRVNNLDDALTVDAFDWARDNPARRVPGF